MLPGATVTVDGKLEIFSQHLLSHISIASAGLLTALGLAERICVDQKVLVGLGVVPARRGAAEEVHNLAMQLLKACLWDDEVGSSNQHTHTLTHMGLVTALRMGIILGETRQGCDCESVKGRMWEGAR